MSLLNVWLLRQSGMDKVFSSSGYAFTFSSYPIYTNVQIFSFFLVISLVQYSPFVHFVHACQLRLELTLCLAISCPAFHCCYIRTQTWLHVVHQTFEGILPRQIVQKYFNRIPCVFHRQHGTVARPALRMRQVMRLPHNVLHSKRKKKVRF